MPANPIGVALRNRRAGQHTLVWARPDLVIAAIAGHVIGRARLDGTYENR
jgi:hypothetical protein